MVTALFAAMFISCDKDDDNNSSPTPLSGGISGTIEGDYASWDLVGISLGESDIVETTSIVDGKFSFSSLPTPKPEDFEPLTESEDMPAGVQISNKDAKICTMSVLAIKGDIDASFEGRDIMQVLVTPNSITMVMYCYVDRDVTIKGSVSDTEEGIKFTSEVDLNLKQGWNTMLMTMTGTEKDGLITSLKNGVPPSGAVWMGM